MIALTVQCSLGRFTVSLDETQDIRAAKTKVRQDIEALAHVNLKSFRFNVDGQYLSDESLTLKAVGVTNGAVLHLVKKTACPMAALDTEKKTDEE